MFEYTETGVAAGVSTRVPEGDGTFQILPCGEIDERGHSRYAAGDGTLGSKR